MSGIHIFEMRMSIYLSNVLLFYYFYFSGGNLLESTDKGDMNMLSLHLHCDTVRMKGSGGEVTV